MMESALPSPQIGGKGHHLRRVAASAISSIQVTAPAYTGGKHPNAVALKAFFDAASAAVAPYVPAA